jgi:Asp-tRNA(Asn)/Glu-tRNA(Gln) amidotransferase A subunit family amidase
MSVYTPKPWKAPRVAGGVMPLAAAAAEGPLGALIARKFLEDVGVAELRRLDIDALPSTCHPVFAGVSPVPSAPAEVAAVPEVPPGPPSPFASARDFTAAYASGRVSPADVAERVLEASTALDQRNPPMRVFIAQQGADVRAQAAASAARWRAGRPLGPLDGVPVAVKDELDVQGYPTTVGTSFQGGAPARADAFVVARLRAAGAVIIGKANMHEIGIGVSGINVHHGACRNPYHPEHMTGGSSSGSAAAVAAGLCPIAVGADGGGSVRIPAALCGVFGLKATFGRLSETGAAPLCWSVAHVGPLTATAYDLALAHAIMAGADPHDPNTLAAPPVSLSGFDAPDLRGLKIGVFEPWFNDADAEVVHACEALVAHLRRCGAEVRKIVIPGLELARTAHVVTIVSEMAASQARFVAEDSRRYSPEVRLSLALAAHLRATDRVQAERYRTLMFRHFMAALAEVDVIAAPSVACTAPRIPDDALEFGMSDIGLTDRVMRFAAVSNLTGLPSLTVPAGYDLMGLPIGLQFIGRPWSEALLLRFARHAEAGVERQPARVRLALLA